VKLIPLFYILFTFWQPLLLFKTKTKIINYGRRLFTVRKFKLTKLYKSIKLQNISVTLKRSLYRQKWQTMY